LSCSKDYIRYIISIACICSGNSVCWASKEDDWFGDHTCVYTEEKTY